MVRSQLKYTFCHLEGGALSEGKDKSFLPVHERKGLCRLTDSDPDITLELEDHLPFSLD